MPVPIQNTDFFNQLAAGYAPMAQGIPHVPRHPLEGVPGMSSGPLSMAGIFATPYLASMMGQVGMVPMGMGHDQNVYDTMRNQRFTAMQMSAMQEAAKADREGFMRTIRGIAAVTGTPYGAEQRRAAGALSDLAVTAAPVFARMMPEFMDQMAGTRGSAAVMAQHLIGAGRYRVDPVSGRMGMSGETVGRQTQMLYQDLFLRGDLGQTAGLSAGRVGGLVDELQRRGMMTTSAAERPLVPGLDNVRGQVVAALESMRQSDPAAVSRAMANQGIRPSVSAGGIAGSAGATTALTAGDLDKLMLEPAVADKLRAFDGNKLKQSIKSWSSAVAAMRDIFGDIGKPDAPMAELVRGLEALSGGSMAQIDPGRLGMMARQTYNLARQSGVTLDGAMMLQQHAAMRGQQLGVEPIFAVQATQGALAYGGAYRSQGHAGIPAWGAMGADELQQLNLNLRMQASGSNMANRVGAVMRLRDMAGPFNGEAAAVEDAIRAGRSEYTFGGQQRTLNMDDPEFLRIFKGAGGLNEGGLRSLLRQRGANREYGMKFGAADIAYGAQFTDVGAFVADRMNETISGQLIGRGVDPKRARQAAAAIAGGAVEQWRQLSTADNSNTGMIGGIFEKQLNAAGYGDVLGGMDAKQRDAFLSQTANLALGHVDESLARSPYSAYGSAQNIHRIHNPTTRAAELKDTLQAAHQSQMQQAMAPLVPGSMLSRVVDAVQAARPGDRNALLKVVSHSLGGVSTPAINSTMLPVLSSIQERMAKVKELQDKGVPLNDPQMQAAYKALRDQSTELAQLNAQYGAFTDSAISGDDLQTTLGSIGEVRGMQSDLLAISAGFGDQVTPEQRAEARGTLGKGLKSAEARAVILARRMRDLEAFRGGGDLTNEQQQMLDSVMADVKQKTPGLSANRARTEAIKILGSRQRLHSFDPSETRDVTRSTALADDEVDALVRARRGLLPARVSNNEIADYMTANPHMTRAEVTDLLNTRQRARRFGIEGDIDKMDVAAIGKIMTDKQGKMFEGTSEEVAARYKEVQQRFALFHGGPDGAIFGEATDRLFQDVDSRAQQLLTAPGMIQRLGSRALTMHEELQGNQQRLRDMAALYADNDLSRLMSGNLTIDWSKPDNVEQYRRVMAERETLTGRNATIINEIGRQHGADGRQFALGDRHAALETVLQRQVAGGMSAKTADAIRRSQLTPVQEAQVQQRQLERGSERAALNLMGLDDAKTPWQRAQMAGIRWGLGNDQHIGGIIGEDKISSLTDAQRRKFARGLGSTEQALHFLQTQFGLFKDKSFADLSAEEKQQVSDTAAGLQSDATGRRMLAVKDPDIFLNEIRRGTASRSNAIANLGLKEAGLPDYIDVAVSAEQRRVGANEEALYLLRKGGRGGTAGGADLFSGLSAEQLAKNINFLRDLTPEQEAEIAKSKDPKDPNHAKYAGVRGLVDSYEKLRMQVLSNDALDPKALVERIYDAFGYGKVDLGTGQMTDLLRRVSAGGDYNANAKRILGSQRNLLSLAGRGAVGASPAGVADLRTSYDAIMKITDPKARAAALEKFRTDRKFSSDDMNLLERELEYQKGFKLDEFGPDLKQRDPGALLTIMEHRSQSRDGTRDASGVGAASGHMRVDGTLKIEFDGDNTRGKLTAESTKYGGPHD